MNPKAQQRREDLKDPRTRMALQIGYVYDCSRKWKVQDEAARKLLVTVEFALYELDQVELELAASCLNLLRDCRRNRLTREQGGAR
jgi:hypothetical protein